MTDASGSAATAVGPVGGTRRVAFLDAVRAVAATMVVLNHFRGSARFEHAQRLYVSFGTAGVLSFFLCSGFIIPASIERARSVKVFWIGRFFRLWPAYLLVTAMAILLTNAFDTAFGPTIGLTPVHVVANLTMAASLLGQPQWVDQAWTLGVELLFYIGVTILFVARLLRFSVALLVVALGVTLVSGVAPVLRGHPQLWRNEYWVATMVVGIVVHDGFQGRLPRWAMWAALAAGLATGEGCLWLGGQRGAFDRSLTGTILAGYAVFALLLALADRAFPKPLLRIGLISYSLYLIHKVVIWAVPDTGIGVLSGAIWLGLSIVVADLSFRLIERPALLVGRRLAQRVQPATPAPAPT